MKNKFTLKGKYNLRSILPMLGIAGASMFAASCNEDEPDLPKHDTVYQFKQYNWYDVDTLQIARSADSASVNKIILQAHPDASWEGVSAYGLSRFFDAAFRNAKGKGVASGTLRNFTDSIDVVDVERIKAYGFQIEWKDKQH